MLKISNLSKQEILSLLEGSARLKADRHAQAHKWDSIMHRETMLMLFEKPSLRTRVSFETGLTDMGAHAIYYSIADSPLGVKETASDTAKVLSRYVSIIVARLKSRKMLYELAENASIPVINALDDFGHPCQIIADLLTIREHRPNLKWEDMKMAYFGDTQNNVTYDIMRAAAVLGFTLNVSGPKGKDYEIEASVLEECKELCAKSKGQVNWIHDPVEAVKGVHVVYTDSWMSYTIPKDQLEARQKVLMPYQVTTKLLSHAANDVIFMNCLPAARGMEQTAEVIDGPKSVVFDEAENRLHTHKAITLFLLGKLDKVLEN